MDDFYTSFFLFCFVIFKDDYYMPYEGQEGCYLESGRERSIQSVMQPVIYILTFNLSLPLHIQVKCCGESRCFVLLVHVRYVFSNFFVVFIQGT